MKRECLLNKIEMIATKEVSEAIFDQIETVLISVDDFYNNIFFWNI